MASLSLKGIPNKRQNSVDMSQFSNAKLKRENFVSHNDKATEIVDELLESKDKIEESLAKITSDLGKMKDIEKIDSFLNSLVLQLAHSRDNNLIEKFLEHMEGTEHWAKAYHDFVLKLTCNDDWNTLDTVLEYGKERGLKPGIPGDNPIAIASEQVSHFCQTIF